MFRHEDFSGQLVWALQRYVQVDIQGPEQSLFEEETQEPPTAPGEGTNQQNEPAEETHPTNAGAASNTIPNNTEELHPLIQEMLDWGGNNLDNDDIVSVMAAAPMIDDDNQPAPENLPSTEDSTGATNDIMGQWTHSGICNRKATIQRNAKPELTFWTSSLSNPSNLNLFEGLFFLSFIKTTILPQTNQNLPHGEKPILYGEFLRWIGLWMLMGLSLVPRGESSGQPAQSTHFMGPDVWQRNPAVGSMESRKEGATGMSFVWGCCFHTSFQIWVTRMYDVAVAVKFVRLDCLS